MDICASNGVDSEQIVESIGSAKLDQDVDSVTTREGELLNEVTVPTEGEVVQEFVVLNSPRVKPLAAAPRMPQQSVPRNTTQEEAAGVPSSVPTPSFAIPPHLMGRNVDNPTEDMIGSGRKLQKPRLGVRVPYRNLTSQIVTQDEIAQELLERSLKKHPVHDTPEGGDLFFAMKLTQRLANRLSPSAAVSSGVGGHDIETIASKSGQFQQSADANCLLPPGYTLVPESTTIPDHGELLAILEGDADPDWMPDTNPPTLEEVVKPVSLVDSSRPPAMAEVGSNVDHISIHTIPPKLDPLVEREMALKQLMELPIRTKKKKTEPNTKRAKTTQKSRERGKKESQSKKDESNSVTVQINPQDSENNNRAAVNGNPKVEIDSTRKQKQVRKRKLTSVGDVNIKRPNIAKKKKADTSASQSVVITGSKKSAKKPKFARAVTTKKQTAAKNSLLNNGVTGNSAVGIAPKRRKVTTPNSCDSKSAVLGVVSLHRSVPGTSAQNAQESADSNLLDKNSDDEFSESLLMHSRKFATPPRTYSPRKRVVKPGSDLSSSPKKNAVAAILVKEIGITLSQCTPNSSTEPGGGSKSSTPGSLSSKLKTLPSTSTEGLPSKVVGGSTPKVIEGLVTKNVQSPSKSTVGLISGSEEASSSKPGGSVSGGVVITPHSAKRNVNVSSGQVSSESKRKRMREIDRLLMDEGAINLLYEVEQGESKRRSGPQEGILSSPKRKMRSPLKSVRRQKKDLQLKTRLVKNAVLRLSSVTPSPSTAVALRGRRQIGPPTLQLATSQNPYRLLQRKKSLDSRESIRSPPPLTPVDPPSPSQSFSFPPRLHLPAEASRIIRRHSSSSTFSSRSTSPNLQHRNSVDSVQSPENFENKPDNHDVHAGNSVPVPCGSKSSSELDDKKRAEVRKKGVPIFVRKQETTQTYKGKKKDPSGSDTESFNLSENAERLLEMKCKELKIHHRTNADINKKAPTNVDLKKKVLVSSSQLGGAHKKISCAVRMKIKTQMTKNFQRGVQKGKSVQFKKSVSMGKLKKKDVKERVDAVEMEMPDLTSCLAAVATEFATGGENIKKVTHLRRSSHDSSPGSSPGSKSPSSNQQYPHLRKEAKEVPPPLSPNASSKLTFPTLVGKLLHRSLKLFLSASFYISCTLPQSHHLLSTALLTLSGHDMCGLPLGPLPLTFIFKNIFSIKCIPVLLTCPDHFSL